MLERVRSETYRRAARDGLTLVGLAVLVLVAFASPGVDVHAYWSVNPAHPYGALIGAQDAFLYSPVAALAALPLRLLSFGAARILFIGLDLACLVYLAGPWALALVVLFPPVALELYAGNVQLLMAAAIVAGFRRPAAWSFVLLTKVTPGVGLIWFAIRREWRSLAIALGATVILSVASLVIEPTWWPAWFATLAGSVGRTTAQSFPIPLAVRVPAALAFGAWGARSDRRWTVPVAATLALPVLWWTSLSMLVGVLPLVAWPRHSGRSAGAVAAPLRTHATCAAGLRARVQRRRSIHARCNVTSGAASDAEHVRHGVRSTGLAAAGGRHRSSL